MCIAEVESHVFLGNCQSTQPNIIQEKNIQVVFHIGFVVPEHDKITQSTFTSRQKYIGLLCCWLQS